MIKNCHRCHQTFECNADHIEACFCNSIEIKHDIKLYLKETNYDCLCENCLNELNNFLVLKEKYPFPENPKQFVKGIHYYMDGPYWVFTNYYHFLKGKCCKNNCRHCAYGFKNK